MLDALKQFWSTDMFMPHGHCYLWNPVLLWLQVIANLAIGLAYVAISSMLAGLVLRVREIPFRADYLAFGAFIISCGITHFFDILVIWKPAYWADGALRAFTALASVGTALVLPPLLPQAAALARGARAAATRGVALQSAVQDLENMYQRSRALERLKSDFFANVSHELRTPLTLILGPLEEVLQHDDLHPESRGRLQVVQRNADALLHHVNTLLDLARLEVGALALTYERLDGVELVEHTAGHFAALATSRTIELGLHLPAQQVLEVDGDKVRQILTNLLANAFKFTPPGGSIAVRLEGDGQQVHLHVEDSGPGVPEAMRAHIFDRFVQADGGAARSTAGSGLGLAIVHELATLHGGSIGVGVSRWGGAAFSLHLPRRAPVEATWAPGTAAPPAQGDIEPAAGAPAAGSAAASAALPPAGVAVAIAGSATGGAAAALGPLPVAQGVGPDDGALGRVLVVEDNVDMNAFVSATLAATCTVFRAHDGGEGLELARRHAPDLVVADQMMPRLTGEQLLQALRADPALRSTVVLMLTAKASLDDRVHMLQHGAQDYLAKPFSVAELRARVHNLLSLKRTRDLLQTDLESRDQDLAALAADVQRRNVALGQALAVAETAQREAERLSRHKTDFVNLVSHELRTPLTALQLQLHRLQRRREGAGHADLVEQMHTSCNRLTNLIESILTHNRLESGRIAVNRVPIDLAALLHEVLATLAAQAEQQQVRVALQAAPVAPVYSDPELLRIVVSNLVVNAIKFTGAGGQVAVSCAQGEDGQVSVGVQDSGPGIRPEDQRAIFEPFVHLEPVANKHTEGVGLGLSLVRTLTHALGGRVELESQAGRGCHFRIFLPLRGGPDPTPQAHTPAQRRAG